MKNAFFTLLFFFAITFSAQSQINKGTWLLGGDLSLGSSSSTNSLVNAPSNQSNYFNMTPRIGWFISNNLVIGLSPRYSSSFHKTTSNNAGNTTSTGYSIAPFVRYYKPLNEKWAIFAEFDGIGLNFSSSKYEGDNDPNVIENSSQGYSLGIFVKPGVTYFISPKVGIEASLGSLGYGFFHTKVKSKNNNQQPLEQETVNNSSSGGINLGAALQNISLGIHIYLSGK
jgi:hypothetical protein